VLIVGLDPGSRHTGYGVIRAEGDRLEALDHGRFSCDTSRPMPDRLHFFSRRLDELLDRWQPELAILETPFHGINSRSLIVLAQARGALLTTLGARRMEVREYSPAEIKSAVTGNGRAEKQQVSRMVMLLLGLRGKRPSADASDALAVAICGAHRYRLDRLRGS
jgi:crossover junction endodeoxyribonuclease RuvC